MKIINIIDPGLINLVGHHFDLDLKICRELHQLGYTINIYGSIQSQQNLIEKFKPYGTYHAIFRVGPYVNVEAIDPIAGGYIAFTQHSGFLAHDLKLVSTPGDWIFPSIFAAHVNACAMLKIKNKICGIVHLPIDSKYAQDDVYWRYSILHAASNCDNLRLGVIEPELFFEYQNIGGDKIKIDILPIPYDSTSIDLPKKNELKVIGFFGHQRNEKGIRDLNNLALSLANENYSVILHNCMNHSNSPAHKNIISLGFVDDLSSQIAQCDCVVLPYRMKEYKSKGSGILYDALAAGVPVIAPANTAPGRWLMKSNSGVLFNEQRTASIMNAIQHLALHFSSFHKNAIEYKAVWKKDHGIHPFISKFISHN